MCVYLSELWFSLGISQEHPHYVHWSLHRIRPQLPLTVHHNYTEDFPQICDCSSVAKSCPTVWDSMDCSTQAPLSSTISHCLLRFMCVESMMLSNRLILCCPFSFCLQSFPASGSFPMSWFFASGGQSIGALASVLPVNMQGWFPVGLTAAAAKSLQSCPTLCDPIDGSPPDSAIPGTLQARTLEWVAISFSNSWKWKVKVKSLSRVWLYATPWTAAYWAPPSMGFSRQEYWSGVPLPSLVGLTSFPQIM